LDVDRTPALIEQVDPPEQGNEDADGWAEVAARYQDLTGGEFIRLPATERRAAVQTRQEN
jgi:hypothetical protein